MENNLKYYISLLFVLVTVDISAQQEIVWQESNGFNYVSTTNSLDNSDAKSSESYILSNSVIELNDTGDVEITGFEVNNSSLTGSTPIGTISLYLTYQETFSLAEIHQSSYSVTYYEQDSKVEIKGPNGVIETIKNTTLATTDTFKIHKTQNNKIVLSYNTNEYLITDNFIDATRIAIYSNTSDLSLNISANGFKFAASTDYIGVVNSSDRNWISVKSYDNSGVIKGASIAYYDCLGKPTQSQVRDFKTNKTWITETRYDLQGRPALSTFSSPLDGTPQHFEYKEDLIIQFSDGTEITTGELDANPENPPALSLTATGTPGWYYSNNNTLEPYQDEANGKPYVRTVYDELNPGNVRAVVGGKTMDANNNGTSDGLLDDYPQEFSYTMPAAQELYYAFGKDYFDGPITNGKKEVILKSFKTVSIDAHGNEVVSFTDAEGKVLASARSGGTTQYEVLSVIGEQGYIDIHLPINAGGYYLIDGASGYSVYNLRTGQLLANPNSMSPGNVYRISHDGASDGKTYITDTDEITRTFPDAKGIRYNVTYYDYALNYYDDAGNLKKSTQPLGFNTDAFDLSTGLVNHGMESTYNYNASGELRNSLSPDEGSAQFIYREDGQIRFSQNSKQQLLEYFSYTNYDERGRPTESGVSNAAIPYFSTISSGIPTFVPQANLSISNNTITKTGVTNWLDSGFYSNESTGTGNFEFSFQFSDNDEGAVGVSEINTNGDYTSIDYAIYLRNSEINIINNGSSLARYLDTYTSADTLKIKRENNKLIFLKNNQNLYEIEPWLASNTTFPSFIIDGAINTQGAVVSNLQLDILNDIKSSSQTTLSTSPDEWEVDPITCFEQVFTEYDIPDTANLHAVLYPNGLPTDGKHPIRVQQFVAGNVSKTWTENPETNTTWYSYDVYGRVEWMVQYVNGLGIKTIDYQYDDATGEVKKVIYQRDVLEERFVHKYIYNNIGELLTVETSRDNINFIEHAEYSYYNSGELKRTNLAEGLQGMDYVYTLGGQLKAINHPSLSNINDPGNDQNDVFGLVIDYYRKDYTRGSTGLSSFNSSGLDRYDGNIKNIKWGTEGLNNGAMYSGYTYQYNKNKWLEVATFGSVDGNGNFSTTSDYGVGLTYDANGNILSLDRNSYQYVNGNEMDILDYQYNSSSNQLNHINDAATLSEQPLGTNDIKDQDPNNYIYNSIGQLIRNEQDNLDYAYYTNGLVKSVSDVDASGIGNEVFFYYNDRGHRIKKQHTITNATGSIINQTFYVRDASGQVMAIYELDDNQAPAPQDGEKYKSQNQFIEYPIYGLSRLGMATQDNIFTYEVTDHLGNVRAVIQRDGSSSPIVSEEFSNGSLSNWNASQNSNMSIDIANQRLKVQLTGSTNAPNQVSTGFPVTAGHTYSVRFEVDLDETPFSLSYWIEDGTGGSTIQAINGGTTSQNGEYTFSYTPQTSQTVYLTFSLNSNNFGSLQNNYYLDNVYVTDVTTSNIPIMLAKKDYYPFGMPMPDRNDEGQYRYAYQGQEKDPETGMEAFELRLWDARIGRWLTTDPYGQYYSPYLGMGNDPISGIDTDGGWKTRFGAWWFRLWHGTGGKIFENDHGEYGLDFGMVGDSTYNDSGGIDFGGVPLIFSKAAYYNIIGDYSGQWTFDANGRGTRNPSLIADVPRTLNEKWGASDNIIASIAYNAIDAPYVFFSSFDLISDYPRHIDGTPLVRGSNDHIDTGVEGLISLTPIMRVRVSKLNGGKFIKEINKIPSIGKEIIKRPALRGKLNKIYNLYRDKIGNAITPFASTIQDVTKSAQEMIH